MDRRGFLKFLGAAIVLTAVSPHIPEIAGPAAEVEPLVKLKSLTQLFRECYDVDLLKQELRRDETVYGLLARDDTWKGAYFPVPLTA